MSTKRVRRRGADGRDRIRDIDLGPGRAAATGTAGGSAMGDMQPILTGSTRQLKNRSDGGGWAVSRRFTITSKKVRTSQRWHEPRENNP
jgi:hypothetical protein